MIQKPFDQIVKADIDALLNEVPESKTLEYKLKLPEKTEDAKKKFLADISSFANASGGDLIYGMNPAKGKKNGYADAVKPLTESSADDVMRRLKAMIREGIAPRVRVQIKKITGWGKDGKGFVILIRIPQSFSSPHMVTYKYDKDSARFYSRHSAGKFHLDVAEIRNAFLATDSQAERIRRFRQKRVTRIIADKTPVVLAATRRLILHVIPLATFLNNQRLNLPSDLVQGRQFGPIGSYSSEMSGRYNLDGYLNWCSVGGQVTRYCQLFFNGVVEAAYVSMIHTQFDADGMNTTAVIGMHYEQSVIHALAAYLRGLKQLGISAPIALSLSLLGCKGVYMRTDGFWRSHQHVIDRDAILVPETLCDSLDVDAATVLKPQFDAIWNACGYPGSQNYDSDGKWCPPQR
ncbi:MAG: ATP-binding protein [Phycisphaerales bacterium]|nr:ATP-binding protein [Phycisphaerales bacterium]